LRKGLARYYKKISRYTQDGKTIIFFIRYMEMVKSGPQILVVYQMKWREKAISYILREGYDLSNEVCVVFSLQY